MKTRKKVISKRTTAIVITLLMLITMIPAGAFAAIVDYPGNQGVKAADSNKQLSLAMLDESSGVNSWTIASGITTDDSIDAYFANTIAAPYYADSVKFVIGVIGTGSNSWTDSHLTGNVLPHIKIYETNSYDNISTSNLVASYNDGISYVSGSAVNYGAGAPIIPITVDEGVLKGSTEYTMVCEGSIYVRQSIQPIGKDVVFYFSTRASSNTGGDTGEKVSQKDVEITVTADTSLKGALSGYVLEDIENLKITTEQGVQLTLSDFTYLSGSVGDTLKSLDMGGAEMSVNTIAKTEWAKFTALENLIASPSITSLPMLCFQNNTTLKTVEFPGVTLMNQMCFAGCTSLTSAKFPEVKTIKFHNFLNCTALETIEMGKVETIETFAFNGASNLKLDTFPATLKTIGDEAFEGCTNLGDDNGMIHWQSTAVPSLGDGVFWDSSFWDLKIMVPPESLDAYKAAWSWSLWVNRIFPEGYVFSENVTLNKAEATIKAGSTDTLTATVAPDNATDKTVTWSSSDEAIATVDSNGVVTALTEGSVTIKATSADGYKSAECAVTVVPAPVKVAGVKVNVANASLVVGATKTLTATVTPSNAANKAVTWKSSNSKIAKVDSNGKVTAVSSGKATITVTTKDGGFTAKTIVTVNPKNVNVSLNKSIKATWKKGNLAVTWGKASDADGYEIYAAKCGNKYTKVKTITNNKTVSYTVKKIKGKKLSSKQTYKVQVKAYEVVNGKKTYIGTSYSMHTAGTASKTYTNPKAVKVSQGKSITLKKGATKKISAKVTKQKSKKKLLKSNHTAKLRYFSTNKKVATVTTAGNIKAVAKGSCTIYVVTANGVKTTVKVSVK